MIDRVPVASAPEVKACCAQLYASDAVGLVLGESMHPGGTALTARLAELLDLDDRSTVLDVACGRGASAVYLAQTVGCHVIGVEYGAANVDAARGAAEAAGVAARCTFRIGDAEALPLNDDDVDAIICECALCTFPDKPVAVREFARVVRPRGNVGIADVTSSGHQPGLEDLLAWVACVAGARPVADYARLLREGGFLVDHAEDQSDALLRLVERTRARLVIGTALLTEDVVQAAGWDIDRARTLASAAAAAVRDGDLGYALLTAHLP